MSKAKVSVAPGVRTEWPDKTRSDEPATPASSAGRGLALPAAAIGALAVGALAIGALAIGRLAIRSARIGRLEIDKLVLRDATFPDRREHPPSRRAQRAAVGAEWRGRPLIAQPDARAASVPMHPNLRLLQRIDLRNIAAAEDLFAEDVVWHYHNPNLPDLEGDYVGRSGIAAFFQAVGEKSSGTFDAEPVSATPVGDELVVVHARETLSFGDRSIALNVAVIWRILNGRVAEVWDIVPKTPVGS